MQKALFETQYQEAKDKEGSEAAESFSADQEWTESILLGGAERQSSLSDSSSVAAESEQEDDIENDVEMIDL